MRQNRMGDTVLEPGDNIAAAFNDKHGPPEERDGMPGHRIFTAQYIENDPNFNWSAEITDGEGHMLAIMEFSSEEQLREELFNQGVAIDDSL